MVWRDPINRLDMCPSIPSSVQDAARFSALCPQKLPPPLLLFFKNSELFRSHAQPAFESNDPGVCRLGTNHGFLHCVTAPPHDSVDVLELLTLAATEKHRKINFFSTVIGSFCTA